MDRDEFAPPDRVADIPDSPETFAYASAYLVRALAQDSDGEWSKAEIEILDRRVFETGRILNVKMRRDAEAFATALIEEYDMATRERLEHEYGWDEERHWDRGWEREHIDFDPKVSDLWTKAVREKLTLRIVYDSESSGRTERLVDPVQTSSPYGKAYCHLREEERKFRFDRVLEIDIVGKRSADLNQMTKRREEEDEEDAIIIPSAIIHQPLTSMAKGNNRQQKKVKKPKKSKKK